MELCDFEPTAKHADWGGEGEADCAKEESDSAVGGGATTADPAARKAAFEV